MHPVKNNLKVVSIFIMMHYSCSRLRVSLKRMQDRDIDNLANPHEVKHWMDPKLIPYGWGLFEVLEDDEFGETN